MPQPKSRSGASTPARRPSGGQIAGGSRRSSTSSKASNLSEAHVNRLVNEWEKQVGLKFKSVREAFRSLDLDKGQKITRDEVRDYFAAQGLHKSVADHIFAKCDKDGSNEVTYQEFNKHFGQIIHPGHASGANTPAKANRQAPPQAEKTAELSPQEIKAFMSQWEKAAGNKYKTVREAFRAMDTEHSQKITPDDVMEFFDKMGLDKNVANHFFATCDQDGSGDINYQEFQGYFGPLIHPGYTKDPNQAPPRSTSRKEDPPAKAEPVELTPKQIASFMLSWERQAGNKFATVRDAFRAMDPDRSMQISREEVRDFFGAQGLDTAVADAVFSKVDEDGGGTLSYQEFQRAFGPIISPGYKPGNVAQTDIKKSARPVGAQFLPSQIKDLMVDPHQWNPKPSPARSQSTPPWLEPPRADPFQHHVNQEKYQRSSDGRLLRTKANSSRNQTQTKATHGQHGGRVRSGQSDAGSATSFRPPARTSLW